MLVTPSHRHCSNKYELAREGEKVVSIEWPLLKPDCLASSLLFCERNNETRLKTTCSSVFAMNERRDTVGKMPMKRDVLIMCVSASVRGQKEKMGVWAVDVVGWRSCVCGGENWLLIFLVLSVKKMAKSSAVIEVVGGGEGGQRRELNVLKRLRMSGALLILLWKCEDLAVWTSAEKDESNDWYLLRSDGLLDLRHFLSADRSLVRCSRRSSYSHGLEGAERAGLEERGQMLSRQEVKVKHKVSVAAFTSRDKKWVGEGREEDTTEER